MKPRRRRPRRGSASSPGSASDRVRLRASRSRPADRIVTSMSPNVAMSIGFSPSPGAIPAVHLIPERRQAIASLIISRQQGGIPLADRNGCTRKACPAALDRVIGYRATEAVDNMSSSTTIRPVNSLIFVSDPAGGAVPDWIRGALILSTPSCISVGCYPEQDGPTQVVLGKRQDVDPGDPPAFEGER